MDMVARKTLELFKALTSFVIRAFVTSRGLVGKCVIFKMYVSARTVGHLKTRHGNMRLYTNMLGRF